MLEGTFARTTNQEDCIIYFAATNDDTGDPFDISGASIVCEVRSPEDRSVVLSATNSNGVTFPDNFTIKVQFTRTQMQALTEGHYDIGVVATLNGETVQLARGTLPVQDGVVSR